jgi:glycosyltransferase involved in cell wall biosynthesis
MRLVLIGPVHPYRGGIAHYTTLLNQALLECGHEVLLISFRRQYPRWLFPGKSDLDPSQQPLQAPTAHYWLDSLNPFTWLTTFGQIRRYRPTMIVLPWWTTFWAPVWLALAGLNRLCLGVPLVFICHNVLPHEVRVWDRILTKLTLRCGRRWIVQSAQQKAQLLTLLAASDVKIAPHPVYSMFAHQKISKTAARAELGLPPAATLLLFFGIVREYKGLRDLLLALPAIYQQWPSLYLCIAGEFWGGKQPYLSLIDELQLHDRVQIDDRYIPNEEVGLYFSAADLLVAPYRAITGSGALQMAAGFGLPVVAPRVAGPGNQQTDVSEALATAVIAALQGNSATPVPEQTAEQSWHVVVDALVTPLG